MTSEMMMVCSRLSSPFAFGIVVVKPTVIVSNDGIKVDGGYLQTDAYHEPTSFHACAHCCHMTPMFTACYKINVF